MTKLEDIENAIAHLSDTDLAKFRAWFEDWQERQFDVSIEKTAGSGTLDWLADEAREEQRQGASRPLK